MNTKTKTQKLVKKGFSLMELLIVMVILAGLATMIIPNMSSGTEAAKLTSMRNDARTAISALQAEYINDQDYTSIIGASAVTAADTSDNGISNTALENGTALQVSQGNSIEVTPDSAACFSISVSNSAVTGKTVQYDSCNDGKISVVTE